MSLFVGHKQKLTSLGEVKKWYQRWWLWAFFVLFIVVLANASPGTSPDALPTQKKLSPGSPGAVTPSTTAEVTDNQATLLDEILYYDVVEVIDGDTFKVNLGGSIDTVRLIGIDTPETVHPTKPVQCFGIEASNKAKEWLGGKQVRLESEPSQGERDKYSRLLAYAYTRDGLFYNLEIIKQGYAYEYTYNLPYKYQAEFKAAEESARTEKRGLWADGVCQTAEDTTAPASDGQTDVVAPVYDTTEPEPVISQPGPTPNPQAQYTCSSNVYNCDDFSTHAEAQAAFEKCGGVSNDVHELDRDKDGSACETLP